MQGSTLISRFIAAFIIVVASAAAYSQPNTWSYRAHMLMPRTSFGAATGPDGRIYAIGGKIGFASRGFLVTNTVEAYSPSTNSWTFVASTPDLYDNVRAVTGPDGKIYATNGSKLDAYDTSTDTWT